MTPTLIQDCRCTDINWTWGRFQFLIKEWTAEEELARLMRHLAVDSAVCVNKATQAITADNVRPKFYSIFVLIHNLGSDLGDHRSETTRPINHSCL